MLAALCSLMFANSQLNFKPLDHLELFAGVRSITSGEWKEKGSILDSRLYFQPPLMEDFPSVCGYM